MSEQESDTRVLRAIGLASVGLYATLAVFFRTVPRFSENAVDEVIPIVIGGALACMYFLGWKFAAYAPTSTIVVFAVLIALTGVFIPPFDSTDVFFYVATGWQQTHYGYNPYSTVLRNIDGALDDPMIRNKGMERNGNPWPDIPIPYGFLFALLTRAVAWLGRGNFWVTLWLFSSVNLLIHACTAWLLWKAGKLLPDANGKVILYLYSWNPFVVLQYLANLHNDIIVACLVVAAAYLVLKDRPVWSVPLLVTGGLIKYVTLALVPFALIFLLRRKTCRDAVHAIVISAALITATAAPYVAEFSSFRFRLIWAQLSESRGSLHTFGFYTFRALSRISPALQDFVPSFGKLTKVSLWAIFAVFVARELYKCCSSSNESPLKVIQRWTLVMLGLILVASSQFYAWYLGMVLPLGLLANRQTVLAACVVALSGTHMLSFTFLMRRAIGYFVLATLLPTLYLLLRNANGKRPATLFKSLKTGRERWRKSTAPRWRKPVFPVLHK